MFVITARWKCQGSLLIALWLIPPVRPAEPLPAPALPPITGIRGALVLHGGGDLPDAVRSRFLKLAGGSEARLVIIPTARADADTLDSNQTLEPWKKQGVASVVLLHTRSRERANDPAFIQPLTEATGVWLEDGDLARPTAAYRDTAVHRELRHILARNGVLGGTVAGAALLGPITITGDGSRPRTERGFAFLPGGVVEAHALRQNRVDRLLNVLAKHPGMYGIGIDEQTALVVQGRHMSVVGDSYVVTCQSASSTKPAGFRALKAGDQADLVALSRSAIARTQPPFPPAIPPVPYVARGTLIIGGGGGLSEDVWKRFIQDAGGPEALIIVIPTANPDPVPVEPSEARALKRAGAKNVRILHTRDRAEANSSAFVEPLERAGGVWFSGGRQWRFVDAYEGTAAERAFHAVLERGGVIGGSSAGASIQSAYMPRGDPLGNLNIIAEGYERGFGFLQGVAIDQHFFQRRRFPDMTDLMAVYPQLLGIGIGEGTVLVVQGSVMEVVGKSPVAVYDRRRPVTAGAKDYEELTPGTRYNLAIRERVDSKAP
jgi:cyanophycinase